MTNDIAEFERKAGIAFRNPDLIRTAFTHRSYVNEHKRVRLEHNERLEFLGDAVLELVITEFLFEKYPLANEGDLTSYRAALVNTNTLSEVGRTLGINEYLLLSKGESKDLGRARQYILANAFEALIGAIFLDSGYAAAKDFIARNLFALVDKVVANKTWLDSKSHFQEKSQEIFGETPAYKTLNQSGPDHDKCFTIGVFVGSELVAKGEGRSKQEAEQEAASLALVAKGWK